MAENVQPTFTREFWKSFDTLGIYSKEDGPLLSDQLDSGVAGGSNSSDASEKTSETKEQNNDMNLGFGTDTGSDNFDLGGDTDGGFGDDNGSDESNQETDAGSADMSGASSEPENPNENPFKKQNGKSLLDNKLSELQAAISDTLQRIYSNPKINTVVVSELETLLDSVRNIRETTYLIPIEQIQYKYKLATISYAQLSEQLVEELNAEIKKL